MKKRTIAGLLLVFVSGFNIACTPTPTPPEPTPVPPTVVPTEIVMPTSVIENTPIPQETATQVFEETPTETSTSITVVPTQTKKAPKPKPPVSTLQPPQANEQEIMPVTGGITKSVYNVPLVAWLFILTLGIALIVSGIVIR